MRAIESNLSAIRSSPPLRLRILPYGWAMAAVGGAGCLAAGLENILPLPNLSLVFLLAVLLVGMRFGTAPALWAGLLSFAIYNFFFTLPYFTFSVENRGDSLTLAFFVVVAALSGSLAGYLQNQTRLARRSALRSSVLYGFSRKLASARSRDEVSQAICRQVEATLGERAAVLLPEAPEGPVSLARPAGETLAVAGLSPADAAAAKWAWTEGVPAGRSTVAHADASRLFVPLATARGPVGVLGVEFPEGEPLSLEQEDVLNGIADQAAVALESTRLAADAEKTRLLNETESLRAALLSSISHDLRTPLVSVIGSATTLSEVGETISPAERRELIETILTEARRLNRFVQNLLDMTRLGYGRLTPRRDWTDVAEMIGHAVHLSRDVLAGFEVAIAVDSDLPLMFLDPVLMEQVLVNILDNAAKASPAGGRIAVAAKRAGDCVEIRVEDEGPGIPAADRKLVFDMFYRVESGDSRTAGTGLGLAICKGLIAAHGGTIAAEDSSLGGAALVIRLPLDRPPPPADEGEEP